MTKLITLLAMALSLPAFAQTERVERPAPAEKGVVVKTITFACGDFVSGSTPLRSSYIQARPAIEFPTLVRVRADFAAELQQSAEKL